jgi:hypothetical protein
VWEVGPGQETNGCDYSCSHIYKELSSFSGIGNTYRDIFLLSDNVDRKEVQIPGKSTVLDCKSIWAFPWKHNGTELKVVTNKNWGGGGGREGSNVT